MTTKDKEAKLRLPPAMYRHLEALATAQGSSWNSYVRQILEAHLQTLGSVPTSVPTSVPSVCVENQAILDLRTRVALIEQQLSQSAPTSVPTSVPSVCEGNQVGTKLKGTEVDKLLDTPGAKKDERRRGETQMALVDGLIWLLGHSSNGRKSEAEAIAVAEPVLVRNMGRLGSVQALRVAQLHYQELKGLPGFDQLSEAELLEVGYQTMSCTEPGNPRYPENWERYKTKVTTQALSKLEDDGDTPGDRSGDSVCEETLEVIELPETPSTEAPQLESVVTQLESGCEGLEGLTDASEPEKTYSIRELMELTGLRKGIFKGLEATTEQGVFYREQIRTNKDGNPGYSQWKLRPAIALV